MQQKLTFALFLQTNFEIMKPESCDSWITAQPTEEKKVIAMLL